MRFTYAEAMTDPSYYAPLAQAAEAAGYTSMTVADSLIYPQESDSTYPYTDTGDREFLEDKAFIETMILCAHLFAVTTTLRLTPFVLKLPVRPPVLVAKQVELGRLALGQPARARHRPLAVARGLRGARRAVGAARQADGRVHRRPARADQRRLLRVRRGVLPASRR